MRILIIGINYRPEMAGIGPYTAGLAEHLRDSGYDVSVVSGLPHYPDWRLTSSAPRQLIATEEIAGIRVTRAAHYVPSRQTAVGRLMYEGTFLLTSLLAATLRQPRPAVILGIVPALTGGIVARMAATRHGVPYGILFQDLMGPAGRESGIEGGRTVARLASAAERWAAQAASAVGVISEAFQPYLQQLGVDPALTHVVPNWTRPMEAALAPDEVRDRFHWDDGRAVVLHGGNIGLKQGLEQVIEAAQIASHRDLPVRFVLAGGGNQEATLRSLAEGLANVDFVGVQPDGVYASLLRAADILLLSERPTQLNMSLPSKLTSYLSAGRPIVAAVPADGPTAVAVRASGAGIVVPAGAAAQILAAIEQLSGDPALAAQLAAAGQRYARERLGHEPSLERARAFVNAIST